LFLLEWNTEEMIPYAWASEHGNPLISPTGKDLWTLNRDVYVEVFPDDWGNDPELFVEISVWAVNPSREAICNVDTSVEFIQSATLGLIDINYQIWTIFFNIFSVVVILLTVFGLPYLLFKLIMWIIGEVKNARKLF
jgi:hypothetical protein